MAVFAKVSTPTISRFEQGEKNIHLSSILSILAVLGMVDQRRLDFPMISVKYFFDRKVVCFTGQDGNKKVICEISREALNDCFNGDGQDPMKTFTENQLAIEHEARRKYIDGQVDAEGTVSIKSEDLR